MDIEAMTAIFQSALSKYRKGALKYGDYDPLTDRRDMAGEAEEEILDAINYLAMFLMKLRAIRGVDTSQG
ncbi:MAG: hypothetical protein WCW53_15530 [Syntrophales bacterium]